MQHFFEFNDVAILSVFSTYFCIRYEIYADFPLTIIGIAVVFPIVFSISTAYARREKALTHYANLKAHGRAMFFATRDWMPNSQPKHLAELKYLLKDLLKSIREMFLMDLKDSFPMERHVYAEFSEMSKFINRCAEYGMPDGGISRNNQYLSKMLDAFESMKHIYEYRTPVTLRAYSKIFVHILPVLYGPYFALLAKDIPPILFFLTPILFSITLVTLDNIQDHLENPFDMVGEDDVEINEEKFITWLDL
jgi:hypothetical protein